MPSYKADLRDARFILHEVFDAPALWARLPALAERIDAETANAILDEAAKVTSELLAPLNRSGDEEGAQWLEGRVRTPAGFPEAYATYAEGGWVGWRAIPNTAAWACRRCSRWPSRKCSTRPIRASRCIRR